MKSADSEAQGIVLCGPHPSTTSGKIFSAIVEAVAEKASAPWLVTAGLALTLAFHSSVGSSVAVGWLSRNCLALLKTSRSPIPVPFRNSIPRASRASRIRDSVPGCIGFRAFSSTATVRRASPQASASSCCVSRSRTRAASTNRPLS